MSSSFEKFQKYRLLTSYFSVVVSIGLVLFLVGILGVVVFNAKSITDHFKEQMAFTIFIDDEAGNMDIAHLRKSLELKDYVKSIQIVSKDEAAKALVADIGEDFISFLGMNPLHNSIDIYLEADFVTRDKVELINKSIRKLPHILEVSYDKPLIKLLNENTKRISFWLIIASVICGVIAILLINASIRLSIYAHRFVIKTMQLVGANKAFIRRPFIINNIKLGIVGALVATIAIWVLVNYVDNRIPEINLMNPSIMAKVYTEIFAIGILITWGSTYIAAQRFLNLRTDNLY